MRRTFALSCNRLKLWEILLLAWMLGFATVPSSAMAKAGSSISGGKEHRQMQRQLEDASMETGEEESPLPVDDFVDDFMDDMNTTQEESSLPVDGNMDDDTMEVPMVDRNGDGIFYNPCSLCQGGTLQADKVLPAFDNATCGEMNYVLENQPYLLNFTYDSCRGELFFNSLFESCCRPSIPYYECEQNVQDYISEQPYNTAVPPILGFDPEERLDVSVEIIYQALEAIEVEEGTATIFVTIYLRWKDPRLAWDVDGNNTCANIVNVWTGYEVEKAGIWIPDFQLLNEIDGIQSMPDYKAHVHADGTVLWVLNGGMKAFCAFRDLAKIPFDILGCQLLFGAGTREHTQLIQYQLHTPDYLAFGGFDITYNEWTVVPELGKQGQAFDNMLIYYDVYFNRATEHYIQNIVIPTVILTYLSFFTFLLDMRVGERLGFGMALALVVVAQQIVTSGMTPISDQPLWLDKFVAYSFYWVLIGVIESVTIAFLFYIREDAENKKKNATEEEMQPLTMEEMEETEAKDQEFEPLSMGTGDVLESMGATKMEKDKPAGNPFERIDDDTDTDTKKDNCFKALWIKVIYKMPLRRLDMIILAASIISYTLYVMVMVSTGSASDAWLSNEPYWFDESSDASELMALYENGNPEKR